MANNRQSTTWLTRLQQWMQHLGRLWDRLRQIGLALRPMRISLLMVLAGAIFLSVDQGLDTVRYFAEHQADNGLVSTQTLAFLAGAFLWAFGAWYWARVMSYLDLPPAPKPGAGVRKVQTWAPRLAGLVAILSLALAFYRAGQSYENSAASAAVLLRLYLYASLAGVVLYLLFVLTRRRLVSPWMAKRLRRVPLLSWSTHGMRQLRTVDQERFGRQKISRLPRLTWVWLAIPVVIALFLLMLFAVAPAAAAPGFGTVGILLLAASGWIALGSAVDMYGMRYRVPVFLLLFGFAIVFSVWNDNHALRTLDTPVARPWTERHNIEAALREWMTRQLSHPTARRDSPLPLFVVAAEGGGIRAAYWTATVLSTLQDRNPCFADQLFALSGVSGGSLGSAVFTALVADQQAQHPVTTCNDPVPPITGTAKAILSEDFLAPAVAATLYPDLVQRILPVPIPAWDRARALESAWENAWRAHTPSNRFAEPLDALWPLEREHWLPALLLNATWVETGKRLIASNLRVQPLPVEPYPEFADVEDVERFYDTRALPLSTAVHLSARFTYVSPAGTLKKNGRIYGRAVDGGYFENSGTTTALEIIKTVDLLADSSRQWKRVVPYVILISNEPVDLPWLDESLEAAPANPRIRPKNGGNEILSPWRTLLNTREARGTYARTTTRWHLGSAHFLHFGLCKDQDIKIPLGWVLSRAVRDAMDEQLLTDACTPYPNRSQIDRINRIVQDRASRPSRLQLSQ